MQEIKKIANNFNIEGNLEIQPITTGNINQTFIASNTKNKYILQQINSAVFSNAAEIMHNISLVTSFLKNKKIPTLDIIKTKDSKNFYHDKDYFRMYSFIDNTTCFSSIKNTKQAFNCGKSFGLFHKVLSTSKLPLKTTIDNFHNTSSYYQKFEEVLSINPQRAHKCKDEINFMIEHKKYKDILHSNLPIRIVHNDPKISNILFDKEDDSLTTIIDLDTVMPGSVLADFGDMIRSGATFANEEAENNEIDLSLFEAMSKGYLSCAKDFLEEEERSLLGKSCLVLTYELAIRFLTDYLENDIYFNIKGEDDNLLRAKNQIALLKSMQQNFSSMEKIIHEILQK